MTKIDTTQLPETINAPWIKRFFKEYYGFGVRVRSSRGRAGYVEVWLPHKREGQNLVYENKFPPELGNLCMRTVYSGSENLSQQNWGGNVTGVSIAMRNHEWRTVFSELLKGGNQ